MRSLAGFTVPRGACDSHVHVFDPRRFPLSPERRYTPGRASVDDLLAHLDRLGLERVVLVQPSPYGQDHGCLLDALAVLGPDRARGVAVLAPGASGEEIAELDRAGICSARLNLEVGRERDREAARARLRALAATLPAHWRISLYGSLDLIAALADDLAALPAAPVIEHFGGLRASQGGIQEAGFRRLLALLAAGGAWLKLSAPYQISAAVPDYRDIDPIVRAIMAAAPDRVLWGSNWPHTASAGRAADADPLAEEPFRREDDAANLGLLGRWIPDPVLREAVLVRAPSEVFGFPGP